MMDLNYPNARWLRLRRETLHKLMRLKATAGAPTWDDVASYDQNARKLAAERAEKVKEA